MLKITPSITDELPEPCLNLSLRKADRVINAVYNRHLAECGLSVSQFSVMRAIHYSGTCTSQVIQEILVLDQTTLSRNLKKLVSDGMVIMKEDKDDRRRKLLSLSAKGSIILAAGESHWKLAQDEMKRILGNNIAEQIIKLSDDIVEKCATTL
jgi:DNA-binding MarR family transcriptional regulator